MFHKKIYLHEGNGSSQKHTSEKYNQLGFISISHSGNHYAKAKEDGGKINIVSPVCEKKGCCNRHQSCDQPSCYLPKIVYVCHSVREKTLLPLEEMFDNLKR